MNLIFVNQRQTHWATIWLFWGGRKYFALEGV